MVEELRWVLESRFARASAVGARAIPADWLVSMGNLFGARSVCDEYRGLSGGFPASSVACRVFASAGVPLEMGRGAFHQRRPWLDPGTWLCASGEAGDALILAPSGSVVAMEAAVAGLPPDAATAAPDTGPIEKLDVKVLQVPPAPPRPAPL